MNTENLTEYPSEELDELSLDINTPIYRHTIFNEICDFIKLTLGIVFMCACIVVCLALLAVIIYFIGYLFFNSVVRSIIPNSAIFK